MKRYFAIILLFFLSLSIRAGSPYDGCQFPPPVLEALAWIDQRTVPQYDSARHILEVFEASASNLADTCRALLMHRIGFSLDESEAHEKITLYKSSHELYTRQRPVHAAFSIRLLNNIAGQYNNLGDRFRLDSFPVYIQRAMAAEQERKAGGWQYSDQYGRTAHWYGRYQKDLGNHQYALYYMQAALTAYQASKDTTGLKDRIAGVYNDLSILYALSLGQADQGIEAARRGLSYKGIDPETRNNLQFNLALALELKGGGSPKTSAKEYYQAALEQYQLLLRRKGNPLREEILNNLGVVYNKLEAYAAALEVLQQAVAANDSLGYTDQLAKNYDNIGDAYRGQLQIDKAIDAYMQAVRFSFFDFSPEDVFALPDLSSNRALDQLGALESLQSKAAALIAHYQSVPSDITYLESAGEHYQFIDQLLDLLRRAPFDEPSKLRLAKRVKPIYEQAIRTCMLLKVAKPDSGSRYDELAWRYAERSKAITLLEWMNVRNAAQMLLPASSSQQLFDLIRKKDAAQLAYDLATIDQDEAGKAIWRDHLTDYLSALQEQKAAFSPEYVHFQQMEAGHYDPPSLAYVREKILKDNTAVVEYFLGDQTSYAFVITKNEVRTVPLAENQCYYSIQEILAVIQASFTIQSAAQRASMRTSFIREARHLYQLLVAPLGAIPEEVILIPDEYLLYFPFEVLLSRDVSEATHWPDFPYWIKEKTISYNYSIALLKAMKEGKKHRKPSSVWGSFAPEFPSGHPVGDSLGNLRYSAEAAISVARALGETPYHREAASLSNFVRRAARYQYLQLATHGLIHEGDSNLLELVFWDGSLFMKDLYTQELQADLVILNACKTNIGKLHKGAGVASLSRGFVAAGVGSVLSTLWSVHDYYTPRFMSLLTDDILVREPTDKALRNTKLQLIREASDQETFMWAGYVLYGDTTIPYSPSGGSGWWWLIVPVLITILLVFRIKRQNGLSGFLSR